MKKYKKIIMSFTLVAVLLSTSIKPQAAEAGAVITGWQVLEGIIASFGVTYITNDMISNTWSGYGSDGNTALDDDWQNIYNGMENSYDNKRLEVINGGKGSGNKNDPNYIPVFSDLYHQFLEEGQVDYKISSGTGIWECVSQYFNDVISVGYSLGDTLADKFMQEPAKIILPDDYISGDYLYRAAISNGESGQSEAFTYYLAKKGFCVPSSSTAGLYTFYGVSGSLIYRANKYKNDFKPYLFTTMGSISSSSSMGSAGDSGRYLMVNTFPLYPNFDSGYAAINNSTLATPDFVNPKTIWTPSGTSSPLVLPNPPTNPYKIPSQADVQNLINNGVDSDGVPDADKVPDAMQDFLNNLFPSVNPDPDPNPNPSPSPSPDPEPETTPSTSTPDTEPGQDSDKNEDYLAHGLETVFPFCIPWDLVNAIKVFNQEPEAPNISWTMRVPMINFQYTFNISLKDWESVAAICRTLFTILFIISLIVITRNIIGD